MPSTGGLCLSLPGTSAYVDGAPFTFVRNFLVEDCWQFAALEIEVGTFYTSYAVRASVRINNFEIGKIPPLPLGTLGQELAPVSFHFGIGMMRVFNLATSTATGWNQLTVVPVTVNDALIVGNWRLHYLQRI
jgi:hypothetical protein